MALNKRYIKWLYFKLFQSVVYILLHANCMDKNDRLIWIATFFTHSLFPPLILSVFHLINLAMTRCLNGKQSIYWFGIS